MSLREDLFAHLENPNVQAFLRVIRQGESNQTDSAYHLLYGGGRFESIEDHPRIKFWEKADEFIRNGKKDYTTAAGAYQIVASTWDPVAKQYGLNDFGPTNQDLAAVALISRRGALDLIKEGRLDEALARCAREWASLPGSPYGQPTLTLKKAHEVYRVFGGRTEVVATPTAAPRKEGPMAAPALAIFSALLPTLRDLIPALASVFKPESEVAQRNVAAATIVTDALTKATSSPNLQAAVEAMQADPSVLAAAKSAITDVLPTLVEAGDGGIDGARKASANADSPPFYKQPAFWFLAMVLPLVYMLALSVLFGIGGVEWTVEVRVMVATGLIGLLGAGSAYFWGSSLGSHRKDALIGGAK